MTDDFHQQIIEEFRANQGRLSGPFEGARLILLTTTGARSGIRRTTPVAYLPDGGRMLIIASAGGAPTHPAWYHNLRAHPHVTIEQGAFTFQAEATVLEGRERDRLFERAAAADPGWAEYQARSGRILPVIALTVVDGGPDDSSPGDSFKAIHDSLRRELALVRAEIAESGAGLGAQLRVNCLTLCQGLHHHHGMEENHLFHALEAEHPELAPTLARMREEHQVVQRLLEELQERISGDGSDPATVLADVDRLRAELEAHLDGEEEHLIPILNAATR